MQRLILFSLVLSLLFGQMTTIGWTAETVKIGVGLALTGPIAYLSNELLKGEKLAVEEINKAGGVLGKKIELVVYDHKGIPAEAVSVAKRLVLEDKVAILSIDFPSSAVIATQVISKELKVVQFAGYTMAPDATDKGHPYFFRVSYRAESNGGVLGGYVAGLPNNKKIALVAPNDDYGRGDLSSFKAAFKRIGNPTVVYEDYYEFNQTDFTTMLLKIKSLNPDSYYINVRWPASAIILQQMDDLDMLKGRYLSSSSNFYNKDMAKRVGKLMEGALVSTGWAPEFPDPESQKLLKAYRAKYGDDPSSDISAGGWTAIMVVAMALEKAGTDKDQEKIREAMRQINWKSPQGQIKFDEKGDSNIPVHVLQFKQGNYILIK